MLSARIWTPCRMQSCDRAGTRGHAGHLDGDSAGSTLGPIGTADGLGRQLIAASALAENRPIYTSSPGDFEGIEGLEVRCVLQLDS